MPRRSKPSKQLDLFGHPVEERPLLAIEVVTYYFNGEPVRVVLMNGIEWFVLFDVARLLDYRDTDKAKRLLRAKHLTTPLKGCSELRSDTVLVSEIGLYRLMMRSDKPEAELFQDWITEEVLPSIRRTGTYSLTQKGSLIAKTAKRLKSDVGTAKERVDSVGLNKNLNNRLAIEGACPRDHQAMHNTWYREFLDRSASEVRKALGQRSWETPLDRASQVLLAQRNHVFVVFERKVAEMAKDGIKLDLKDQRALFESIARRIRESDLAMFGDGFTYGVIDHERRGLIVDVVRVLPSPN